MVRYRTFQLRFTPPPTARVPQTARQSATQSAGESPPWKERHRSGDGLGAGGDDHKIDFLNDPSAFDALIGLAEGETRDVSPTRSQAKMLEDGECRRISQTYFRRLHAKFGPGTMASSLDDAMRITSELRGEYREAKRAETAKATWAANKRLETSKFKFKFPRARNLEIIGLVLGCIEAKFCK